MPKLHELAHCRAGDKGDTSILSVIAYRAEDFPLLVERVTVEAVGKHLQDIVLGSIRRYELPGLWALQFVCERSLNGGVTTSLAQDAHGKSRSGQRSSTFPTPRMAISASTACSTRVSCRQARASRREDWSCRWR